MRYIAVCAVCLVLAILVGCGGGGGSLGTENGVRVIGAMTVNGSQSVGQFSIAVFEKGHIGQMDHMVTTAEVGGHALDFRVPEPGVYDLRISYPFAGSTVIQDMPNVAISAPETDLGAIDIGLPAP
jgi:hypothetical protein